MIHRQRNKTNLIRSSWRLRSTWRVVLAFYFAVIFLIPILIWRTLVKFSAKLLRPDLSHMLRSHSSLMLKDSVHAEPSLNFLIAYHCAVAKDIVKDGESLSDVLRKDTKVLAERIVTAKTKDRAGLAFPELSQYCVKWGGFFFWKNEANFRLDDHILVHKLNSEDNFDEFRHSYVNESLPAGKSPWQIMLLLPEGQVGGETGKQFQILQKVHHSLGDAWAGSQLFIRSIDGNPLNPPRFLDPSKFIPKIPGWLFFTTLPIRLVLEQLRVCSARDAMMPWPSLETKGKSKHIASIADAQSIRLDQLKRIASKHGASVTAVVYAALAGALRSHLMAKYGPEQIPEFVRFPQTVPCVFGHPDGLCNTFCSVTLELPVGKPDPRDRLAHCHRVIENRKESAEAILTFLVHQARSLLPYTFPLAHTPADRGAGGMMNITNFPGPLNQVTIRGHAIQRISISSGAVPTHFYTAFVSYNGVLEWRAQGDERIFNKEELKQIAHAIREEFDVLDAMGSKTD